jgi:hypothetical protein
MKTFIKDGIILAKWITVEDWKPGLGFFSDDDEYIQVGTWYYNSGTQLSDHVHNLVNRVAKRTYETIYVVSGKVRVRLYTLDKVFVDTFDISQGDTLILLDSGHGYEILEDNTKILEVKNGPFLGVDVDKVKF